MMESERAQRHEARPLPSARGEGLATAWAAMNLWVRLRTAAQ